GTIVPYPHPWEIACSVQGTPALRRRNPGPAKPNSIMMGTGLCAPAGTVKLAWIFTVIPGKLLLSTWPTRVFVTVGAPPASPLAVAVTSQVTFGTFVGIRP